MQKESALPEATTRGITERGLPHNGADTLDAPRWRRRLSIPAGGDVLPSKYRMLTFPISARASERLQEMQ